MVVMLVGSIVALTKFPEIDRVYALGFSGEGDESKMAFAVFFFCLAVLSYFIASMKMSPLYRKGVIFVMGFLVLLQAAFFFELSSVKDWVNTKTCAALEDTYAACSEMNP